MVVKNFQAGEAEASQPQTLSSTTSSVNYARDAFSKAALHAAAGNSVVIAVMGMTGCGKSTFIKLATGSPHVEVGESLASC